MVIKLKDAYCGSLSADDMVLIAPDKTKLKKKKKKKKKNKKKKKKKKINLLDSISIFNWSVKNEMTFGIKSMCHLRIVKT